MFLFSGLKYQSNLNEIDKSEQKSHVDSSSKVFEWPSKDESHADSKWNLNFFYDEKKSIFIKTSTKSVVEINKSFFQINRYICKKISFLFFHFLLFLFIIIRWRIVSQWFAKSFNQFFRSIPNSNIVNHFGNCNDIIINFVISLKNA